jgi:two-component system chemotaxis sensor kinase CheA
MLFGAFLVRNAARRITQPLAELTTATAAIAAGDRKLRVSIRSRDELEALGFAFNQMVSELDESYARLEGLNRTLEQRVEERTGELAHRNQDLRLVLDTVNEGLLGITADGALTPERSAMIDRWFGPTPGNVSFVEYLTSIDPTFARAFALGYEALKEDVLPAEVCLAQLPARLQHGDRHFAVSYLPLGTGGPQAGLLVVINDITEQLERAQHDIEHREQLAAFQAFSRDRSGFLIFFDEASHLVEDLTSGSLDLTSQTRLLHTLKGNSSLVGLTSIEQLCHDLEDQLEEDGVVRRTPLVLELRTRWLALTESLRVFLGDRDRSIIELSSRELERLCEELGDGMPVSSVIRQLGSLRLEPVVKPLGRLGSYAHALAERLGKGDCLIEIDGHGVRLDPDRWSPLWSEMVHVVRNAVDHGFETAQERVAAGKPARPRLRFGARLDAQELIIEIEDDGQGIDWEGVKESASHHGLMAQSERDLMAALFAPGVTSRAMVTGTSGRGVGLAAVFARVQELAGRVGVTSRPGVGTCWRFSFPVSSLSLSEGPGAAVEPPGLPDTVGV